MKLRIKFPDKSNKIIKQPNQKNNKKNPAVVLRKFKEMKTNAETDENILCFQDACMSIGWRCSKVDYWVKKIPIFEDIKKDIQNIIISRINKNALQNKHNSTASIWRMKMLGEFEVQKVEQTVNSNIDIVVDGNDFED